MHFVTANDGLMFPEVSVTGEQGDLLDTGWDLHWPGPGRVYLSDGDLRDVLLPSLNRPLVFDALVMNGWTPPGDVADRVADLEAQLAAAVLERDAETAKADAYATTILNLNLGSSTTSVTPVGAAGEGSAD